MSSCSWLGAKQPLSQWVWISALSTNISGATFLQTLCWSYSKQKERVNISAGEKVKHRKTMTIKWGKTTCENRQKLLTCNSGFTIQSCQLYGYPLEPSESPQHWLLPSHHTIVAYSSACTLLFLSNSPTIIYVYLFIVELSFQFRVSFLATLLLQRGKWISTHLCQDCKWLTACQCIVKQYLTTCKECFVKFYIQYIHKLLFKIIYPLIIHQITEV